MRRSLIPRNKYDHTMLEAGHITQITYEVEEKAIWHMLHKITVQILVAIIYMVPFAFSSFCEVRMTFSVNNVHFEWQKTQLMLYFPLYKSYI